MAAPKGDPHGANNIDPDCKTCQRVYPEEHARAVAARDRPEPRRILSGGFNLAVLREANKARVPLFKNAKGEPAHSIPDGSDWSPLEWGGAAAGELGEACNIVKKVRRGDVTIAEVRGKLADELADVLTYLDIMATQCGIDLGRATIKKFNEISDRVGCKVKILDSGDGYTTGTEWPS